MWLVADGVPRVSGSRDAVRRDAAEIPADPSPALDSQNDIMPAVEQTLRLNLFLFLALRTRH